FFAPRQGHDEMWVAGTSPATGSISRVAQRQTDPRVTKTQTMTEIARQHWSARRYAETAHFVPSLGAPVLELLAPSAGEHILDLGCGDGVLTQKILAAGATVIAVDAGPDMVAAARARGIDARVMDGQR